MHIYHFVKTSSLNECSIPHNDQTSSTAKRHKRSVAHSSNLWENASTVTISFASDIGVELRDRMEFVIRRWEPFVSLAFELAEDDEGQIRIAVGGNDSYSALGTDALSMDPASPTLVIGLSAQDSGFETTLLHEFGHALGFNHAHLHPDANIPWNKPAVYKYFGDTQGWTAMEIEQNIFGVPSINPAVLGDYDRASIMHYEIPEFLTHNNWKSGRNTTLSEGDKRSARMLYPPIDYRAVAI